MSMKVQSSPIPDDHLQWPFYLEQLQSFFAVFQTGITERVPQGHPDVPAGGAAFTRRLKAVVAMDHPRSDFGGTVQDLQHILRFELRDITRQIRF